MSGSWGESKYSYTWVRFCAAGLDESYSDTVTALTIWHELMHMTSRAGDSSYNKADIIEMAKADPAAARMNADTYLLYAAETGLSRDDYTASTF